MFHCLLELVWTAEIAPITRVPERRRHAVAGLACKIWGRSARTSRPLWRNVLSFLRRGMAGSLVEYSSFQVTYSWGCGRGWGWIPVVIPI